MDNAAIHKGEDVLENFEDHDINYKYLPPYSPDLNPIENVFGVKKSRYSNANNNIKTKCQMIRLINETIENMNRDINFNNFYIRMREFLMKAYNGEFF